MKKVDASSQLDLSKETVANLTEEQLREIEGGSSFTSCIGGSCNGHVAAEAQGDQSE